MSGDFLSKAKELLETVHAIEVGDGRAPTVEDIAEGLGWSLEETHFFLHRMVEHGALALIPSAYEDRYAVEDEDRMETLPDPGEMPSFTEADEDRKARAVDHHTSIGKRFEMGFVDPEKEKLFSETQSRLAGLGPVKANPLDNPSAAPKPAPQPGREDLFSKLSDQLAGKTEKKVNPLDALGKKGKKNP